MRFATDLLYRWVVGTGRGNSQPQDQDVEVPPYLLPVVEVPGPLRNIATITTTEIQRETFFLGQLETHAASQAQADTLLCTFGRGLWALDIFVRFLSDFTGTPGANGGILAMRDPTILSTQFLIHFANLANLVQVATFRTKVLFDRDSFQLRVVTGATGVGETSAFHTGAICSRLN